MWCQIVERVTIKTFQEFPDVLYPQSAVAIFAEVDKVDDGEHARQDAKQEQVLDVERRPDEAPAKRLVF